MGRLAGSEPEYLLDTHTFLWAVRNPARLGQTARQLLERPDSKLHLSAISAYEVTYKHKTGKLDPSYAAVVDLYSEVAHKLGVIDLPLTQAQAYQAGRLDWSHRDPFDRLLVAQAVIENLVIITNDAVISNYPLVETVW